MVVTISSVQKSSNDFNRFIRADGRRTIEIVTMCARMVVTISIVQKSSNDFNRSSRAVGKGTIKIVTTKPIV